MPSWKAKADQEMEIMSLYKRDIQESTVRLIALTQIAGK